MYNFDDDDDDWATTKTWTSAPVENFLMKGKEPV